MSTPPALRPLLGLVGTWSGSGHGDYATLTAFDYTDEWVFTDLGKPFLHMLERTWIDGEPKHTETGYLRLPAPDRAELVMAIPTGQAEICEGACEVGPGDEVTLRLAGAVRNTSTAKQVDRVERIFRLDGDTLTYRLAMAAVGQPMQEHLRATLTRRA